MRNCYKCTTKQAHPWHDSGEANEYHNFIQIDWFKDARLRMEKIRNDVYNKG